jgi:ribose transport system ATP-binding protein
MGLDIDPRTPVSSLTQAQRALLAIARAQGEFEHEGESVLVLDEPTATLPSQEVDVLFTALRRLAAAGAAILYITHRLPELIDLTDAITVFRDGRLVTTLQTKATSEQQLAELMLGTTMTSASEHVRRTSTSADLLTFDAIAASGLAPTSLALQPGEILAVTGAVGSGGAELGRLVYGMTPVDGGQVLLDGKPLPELSPRVARDHGIGYLPADRPALGSFPQLTVAENLLMSDLDSLSHRGRISGSAAKQEVDRLLDDFAVKPPDPTRVFQTLSGGNQQKVLLAKWLRLQPRVLIVDEPTQGIDVNTRLEIYARLRAAVENGLGILWITSDFEEAALVADRVAVFAEGALVRILENADVTADLIAHTSFVVSTV